MLALALPNVFMRVYVISFTQYKSTSVSLQMKTHSVKSISMDLWFMHQWKPERDFTLHHEKTG